MRRLQDRVGGQGRDLSDGHGRWRVYERAIALPESFGLLRQCVAVEEDAALASAVVVGVLGRVDRGERDSWIGVLPAESSDFARKRAAEWGVLEDVCSGEVPADRIPGALPGWSDWLQLRLAEEAADQRVLDPIAAGGRTKRIRRFARESRSRADAEG